MTLYRRFYRASAVSKMTLRLAELMSSMTYGKKRNAAGRIKGLEGEEWNSPRGALYFVSRNIYCAGEVSILILQDEREAL